MNEVMKKVAEYVKDWCERNELLGAQIEDITTDKVVWTCLIPRKEYQENPVMTLCVTINRGIYNLFVRVDGKVYKTTCQTIKQLAILSDKALCHL